VIQTIRRRNEHKVHYRRDVDRDRWYLISMILSFKINEVPKTDFPFDVASVAYQYELGDN